jgi:hypothetical protein
MRKLYNFAAFQAGWFAAVLGAAHGHEALGTTAIAVVIAIHLWITRDRRGEAQFIAITLPIGFVVNTILHTSGAVVGVSSFSTTWLAPAWLLALWPLFGTLFNESMSWMAGRYVVAAAFGVIGAPLSYWAGSRAGAIRLHENTALWIGLVALTWGLAMPLLLKCQARWTPARSA